MNAADEPMIFTMTSPDGGEPVECTVLFGFSSNGRKYLVYTDGSFNDAGEQQVTCQRVVGDLDSGAFELEPLTDAGEWMLVTQYLAMYEDEVAKGEAGE